MIVDDFRIEVEITPAMVMFDRLAGRFSNFVPIAGGRLDVAVRDFFRRRFESEGRVGGGGKWVGLKPWYAKWKRLRVGGRKLLQFKGGLLSAFTRRHDPHQILILTRDSYTLTVDEEIQPRARAHQRGAPSINLPARKIVPDSLPRNFLNELKQILIGYIVRGQT